MVKLDKIINLLENKGDIKQTIKKQTLKKIWIGRNEISLVDDKLSCKTIDKNYDIAMQDYKLNDRIEIQVELHSGGCYGTGNDLISIIKYLCAYGFRVTEWADRTNNILIMKNGFS